MNIKPIKTEKDLQAAPKRIDDLIDAKAGTKEYEELDVLSTLVEAYENEHYPIAPPDPIEAIRFRMEQMHLKKTGLAAYMGSEGENL
jgi:HTH-type transcriptional regulator / antitoxin HigA